MKNILITIMMVATLCGCTNEDAERNPLINPLETPHGTPEFEKIKSEHYAPAFDLALEEARADIEAIVSNSEAPTFENTIEALENSGELLDRVCGIFFALNECQTSPEMETIANEYQPKLVEFSNDTNLNPELFARVKAVYDSRESLELNTEESTLLENAYKGFIRSGAGLNEEDKEAYRKISTELASLSLKFGQNVLAETNAFTLNIPLADSAKVAELPGFVKDGLAAEAKERGEEGWTVTLQYASMSPFLTYSSDRELKKTLWKEYNTLCSKNNEYNNVEVMRRITELRLQTAKLFGRNSYADYVLEERMAQDAGTVNDFLKELLTETKAYADADYKAVSDYAKSLGADFQLMSWDWAYYTEKYKNAKYSINEEEIKPYFELSNVTKGIFMLAEKLYGIKFTENKDIQVFNADVKAYDVTEANGDFVGVLYTDFFPRASKRGGAWMTNFREMYTNAAGEQVRPLVSMTCNFTKPTESAPSLLTFNEFQTFLHEFGHCLHGLFASGKYSSLSGTNVYRDFVELPSQVMENWATESEFLDMFATHYQTGEKMPKELIDKIVNSKSYLAAFLNVRQVAFGTVDMKLHSITEPITGDMVKFEAEALKDTQVLPYVAGTAMTPSFSHIFAGGYAAGYYSYKWAEVLDADAFSLFQEKGIFNTEVAASFRENVLSKGSTENPMDLYVRFRGHKPDVKALIDRMGLK